MNGKRGMALVMVLLLGMMLVTAQSATAQAKPEGEMRWALYVTLATQW